MLPFDSSSPPPPFWDRSSQVSQLLRRILRVRQLDLEYAGTQLVLLCWMPAKVYKMTAWRKQTKNQWARDDPAFLVLLLALLAVSAVAHAIAFHRFSLTGVLFLLLVAWAELVVAGIAIASVCWWVANARLRVHHSHSVEQRVEWLYAFDVHCNGFVPFFLLTHVAQYTLLPLLLRPGFTGTLFSTLLYAAGVSAYHYVSFSGYMHLPFLRNTQVFLAPIAAVNLFLFMLLVAGYNPTRLALSLVL